MTTTEQPTPDTVQEVDRLAAIAARASAATPGPWYRHAEISYRVQGQVHEIVLATRADDGYGIVAFTGVKGEHPRTPLDAEFIAHSREDVPWLLAEVLRLRAIAEAMQATLVSLEEDQARLVAQLRDRGKAYGRASHEIGQQRSHIRHLQGEVERLTADLAVRTADRDELLAEVTGTRETLQAAAERDALRHALDTVLAKPTGLLYAKFVDWFEEPLNRDSAPSAADAAASAVHWFLRHWGERPSSSVQGGDGRG